MFKVLIFIGLKLWELGKVLGFILAVILAMAVTLAMFVQFMLWSDPTPPSISVSWRWAIAIISVCGTIGWLTALTLIFKNPIKYWISDNWHKAGRIEDKFKKRSQK